MITIAISLILLFVPGIALAASGRMSVVTKIAIAPALVAGFVTVLAVALPSAMTSGGSWRLAFGVMAGVMVLTGGLLCWRRGMGTWRLERGEIVALIAVVVAALGWIFLMRAGMDSLAVPLQRRDSAFHMNLLAGVQQGWGTLYPLGSSGWLTGTPWSTAFYPTTFYAIPAVLPAPAVVAANGFNLALIVVWVLGLAALAREVATKLPAAWALAPVLSIFAVSHPLIALVRHGQWPFGMSLTLTPAILALAIHALREKDRFAWVLLLIGVGGQLGTQPGGAVPVVVMILGAALLSVRSGTWMSVRKARIVSLLLPFAYLGAMYFPPLLAMGSYDRPPIDVPQMVLDTILWRHTHVWEPFPFAPLYGLGLALIVGLVFSILHSRERIIGLMLVGFLAIAGSTQLDVRWARPLSAPWYRDTERIQATMTIFVVVLAALGLAYVAQYVAKLMADRRSQVVATVVTLVAALAVTLPHIGRIGESREFVRENFFPSARHGYMAFSPAWSEDDQKFFDHVTTPINQTVIGDPGSGGILLPAMYGLKTMPAVSSLGQVTPYVLDVLVAVRAGETLDEKQCVWIRQNNVGYIYVDEAKNTRFGGSFFRVEQLTEHYEQVPVGSDQWHPKPTQALFKIDVCN